MYSLCVGDSTGMQGFCRGVGDLPLFFSVVLYFYLGGLVFVLLFQGYELRTLYKV